MLDVQQRLRNELQRYSSLVHTLRVVDSKHAQWVLDQLRQGAYDGILLGNVPDSELLRAPSNNIFPWEEVKEAPGNESQGLPPLPASDIDHRSVKAILNY